jgi:multiple sugar transport system permease protein
LSLQTETAAQRVKALGAARPARHGAWASRTFGADWQTALPFMLPMVILLFGVVGWPLLQAVLLVFTRTVGFKTGPFVGLANFGNLMHNAEYFNSLKVTLQFAVSAVFIKFWLGLLVALILATNIPGRNILTALVLIPWVIPEVVKALIWRSLYDPQFGGINLLLVRLHLSNGGISWLGDPHLALPAVTAVQIWGGVPFFIVVLLSGIKALDAEQFNAAAIDGANAFRRFLHITLPGLRYVIIVCCLLSFIWTFNGFGLIYLLTAGGPGNATQLYAILAYRAITGFLYSQGTAIALSTAPVLAVVIAVLGRYMMTTGNEPPSGELPGVVRAVVTPFALFFRGLGWVVMRIVEVLELAVLGLATLLRHAVGRGDKASVFGQRGNARAMRIASVLILAVVLIFELFPFYWSIITAFKPEAQIEEAVNIFWPKPWTVEHFQYMLSQTDFPTWLKNTVAVAVVTTAISVTAAALGAYALVRLRWRGARTFSVLVLITYLVPSIMLLIPMYKILSDLHLNNSVKSLMVTYPSFILPFATWLLMGYYRSIPEELEEAAQMDGCSRFSAFFRVVLPLVKPALMATALFAITASWNEFLFAYAFIFSDTAKTLPVGLAQMVFGDVYPYGNMMAASLMMTIPVVLMYTLGQRYMVEGLTAGSVKGGG